MAKERMTLANMCGGGVQEYIDRALAKVSDNILDINTEAKKKREISIRIIFAPNEDDREDVAVSVQTAVKLAPETGIDTQFFISRDFKSGTISLIEHARGQIKGQLTIDDCGMAMEPEAAREAEKPVEPEAGVQTAESSTGKVLDMRKAMNE